MHSLRIVFMGTPEFAVPTLQALLDHGHDIVGVITAPDKNYGRGGKKLSVSAVKTFALANGLHIMQPTNLKNEQFQSELKALNADVQIVVAFRMLPRAVWDMPPMGTYNLHGSLLPKYRGAAPINWAMMNGDDWTGLTTFKLKHEIDTGSIMETVRVPIYSSDGLSELHDRMMYAGARLMSHSVNRLAAEDLKLSQQDDSEVSHAPKLYHRDLKIDFNQSARSVYDYIRGLSPYPASWTTLDGKKIKIFRASITDIQDDQPIGEIYRHADQLLVNCLDYAIDIHTLQLEGKRRMNTSEFLRGYKTG